jgi:hypothetical protein
VVARGASWTDGSRPRCKLVVEFGVGQQSLQSGVLALQLFEPFRVVGLHAAVLGDPAMPSRLSNLEVPAHLVELLATAEVLVALSELADDLFRRMPPALVCTHVDVDSSCPRIGHQESHNNWTITRGSSHAHQITGQRRKTASGVTPPRLTRCRQAGPTTNSVSTTPAQWKQSATQLNA